MQSRIALILAIVFLPLGLIAQEVDERYVEIYNLLQKADALNEVGQVRDAVRYYQEAEKGLKSLQAGYPSWNEAIVQFRLKYVAARLAALGPQTNQAPVKAEVDDPNSVTNQLKNLQNQIDRMQAQNNLLEAKLREALSVQPAASDPRQLARAEDRVVALEKERDLLRVSLDQEKGRTAMDPAIAMKEQQVLVEVQQRLAEQIRVSNSLRQENDDLRNQLTASTRSVPKAGPGDQELQLQLANATMAALRATNISLRTERILLEERLADLAKQAPATGNDGVALQALRQERDDLKRRLDVALASMARVSTGAMADGTLARELDQLRARLGAYEAQQVPYTADELVFFKKSDLKVEMNDKPPPVRDRQEIPAGAGPLMAEAQRAITSGRFEEAEKLLQQVLRQDEKNVFTLANLASVQMELKRPNDAEASLKRALAIDPRDPASLFLLGRLKYQQQKYDEALSALSLSAQIIPNEARTQYFLGKTLIEKGSRGPAEAALRKAVQLKPGWGEAHHSLAVVYATQDPPFIELAQWHYQKALAGGFERDAELEKYIEQKKAPPASR